MKRLSDLLFALLVTGVLTTSPAHAYLDGGTISLALQMATGAIAGVLMFGRTALYRLTRLFKRGGSDTGSDASEG